MLVLALAACGTAPSASLSNRGDLPAKPASPPMLGERGLRGHEDGSPPTKASLEALLPGAIARVDEVTVVALAGVPSPRLLDKGNWEGIAMVIEERGARVTVFAPQVTMPHRLAVGMTLTEARALQPKLECEVWDPRIGGGPHTTPPPYLGKTCSLASSPSFSFHIHDERIDYISFFRRP